MRDTLQRAWLRRGPLARLLWPVSLLFRTASGLRRGLYRQGLLRSQGCAVPVVVVGNVVAGGAGKTPVLIEIVRYLQARGVRVGVVSRGHGRQDTACREVTASSRTQDAGDEPLLIARRCGVPVFVGARRAQAASALLARYPDVQIVLSDDGLQHLAMARDLEIVVFDDRGVGNGWLLPAGPLREPWPRRADLVLRSEGAAGIEGFTLRRRLAARAVRADGAERPLEAWAGQALDALAGIARPEAFFDMLRARGLRLRRTIPLPDHHAFDESRRWTESGVPLLCTEKDAVKLWRTEPEAWAVPLEVDIDPAFWLALESALGPRLSSIHGPQAA
jgi:tetraacyldisaccharide 4'-kinase